VCGRALQADERVFAETREGARAAEATGEHHVCRVCGRRALLAWADQRAQEAAAARQLARAPLTEVTEAETAMAA
jgi:hypothetical protein